MPELPEVETIKNALKKEILNANRKEVRRHVQNLTSPLFLNVNLLLTKCFISIKKLHFR